MDILLDTHLLLWILIDDSRLPVQAKNIILNDEEFVKGCKMAGFRAVPIKEQHIALLKTLKRKQGNEISYA